MKKICYLCGKEKDISQMRYTRKQYCCNNCDPSQDVISPSKNMVNPRNVKRQMVRGYMRLDHVDVTDSVYNIIGCTPRELRIHLESKFISGMTWDNYGFHGWHIDHKVPISSGHTDDELNSLCHYTNLQPLWEGDNLRKTNKMIF